MALNFPNNPGIGSVHTDPTSGFSYEWDGTLWKSYTAASSNQIRILDDISASFTGIAKTFSITSNSVSLSPANAQSLIINLGGVIQDPIDDYIISGSNIIFSDAPSSGLTFSGVSLGPAIPISSIIDGTVTSGSFGVVGILTAARLQVTGVSTFSGISTFQSSVFGNNLSLTGIVTASSFSGNLTGTASTATASGTAYGLTGSPNVTVGVITATEFDVSGSSNVLSSGGLNVGVATATTFRVGTAVTINSSGATVTGIITATSFSGSGANLTGLPAGYNELDNMLFG